MIAPSTARDHELTCHEVIRLVTDYLDGALSDADRERFEAHIRGCDGCDGYVAQMRATIRLTGRLTPDDLNSESRERLLETFRDWKASPVAAAGELSLLDKLRKLIKR